MAQNNQDDFNKRAVEYLGGHARNVVNSLAGRPVEPVKPWFGEGGLRTGAGATSTASPANVQARQQLAGTPASMPAASQQQAAASGPGMLRKPGLENPAITNLTRNRVQPTVAPPNTSPVNPVTRLASGIGYQPMADGSKVYTMGTQGQDGYYKMTVRPGGSTARQALAGPTADAAQRFLGAVGKVDYNSPEYNEYRARNYQKANPFDQNNPYDERFSYKPPQGSSMPLIAPPPRATGGSGWKSRAEADRANAAAYGDYVRAVTSAMNSKNQEQGANYRAQLQDKRAGQETSLARQRLTGDLALNEARIGTEALNQQKGQMEIEQAKTLQAARDAYMQNPTPENEAKYRAMIGKFEREAQYGTIGKYDDQGTKIGEDIYNKQTGDLKQRGPALDPKYANELEALESDPAAQKEYLLQLKASDPEVYNALKAQYPN
jgi:hypothetical protein